MSTHPAVLLTNLHDLGGGGGGGGRRDLPCYVLACEHYSPILEFLADHGV